MRCVTDHQDLQTATGHSTSAPSKPPATQANQNKFASWLQQFDQLRLGMSETERAFTCKFAPVGRACFNTQLLQQLRQMQRDISGESNARHAPRAGVDFDFMIVGSATPGVYNLGGDLALFRQLVSDGNSSALRDYAQLCVDVVFSNERSYDAPITTIAAVEGSCLGGGFEAALSCDVVIAEEHVKFGFPEILFGLFPGMGAVNFLTRRVPRRKVLDLLLSGKTFSAAALHEMGLIEQVVPRGALQAAVDEYIKRRQRSSRAHAAVHASIRASQPYSNAEFSYITDHWVETAMQLSEKDLKKMSRLAEAQERQRGQILENPRRPAAASARADLAAL